MHGWKFLLATSLVVFSCKKDEKPAGGSAGSAGSSTGATGVTPVTASGPRPSQQPQPPLPPLQLPDDPKRAQKIALGHALFFDKRLSGGSDRTCYSCHQNEHGNGGKDPIAIGSGDKMLERHSPVIWNVGYWQEAFSWDGRAKTLEDNVKGAWGGGNMGMGKDNLDKNAAELARIPGYAKLFDDAFGKTAIKSDHVAAAIAEYMRTLVCSDTAYDRFAAGDKTALSEQQQRGLDVFLGKGGCNVCHAPPFFSSAMNVPGGQYFNAGIGTQNLPEDQVDPGRMKVTNKPEDWAAFKPPSLRNVSRSAPYFHDGSVGTLEDAVRLMASGGIANKNKSTFLQDRKLTDAELGDLVAFLGALACSGTLEEPKVP